MVHRTVLDNGLRLLSEEIAGMPSVTVGIWVENGSRDETPQLNGISHFLEHLLFKGTARRTAGQIAQEIDAIGGALDAFTGKEYTCYYARVLNEHLPLALDLLIDIFLYSSFPQDEIERERSVICQEIAQGEDQPDELIGDYFTHFGRSSMSANHRTITQSLMGRMISSVLDAPSSIVLTGLCCMACGLHTSTLVDTIGPALL